jgi:hypothetical protein
MGPKVFDLELNDDERNHMIASNQMGEEAQ